MCQLHNVEHDMDYCESLARHLMQSSWHQPCISLAELASPLQVRRAKDKPNVIWAQQCRVSDCWQASPACIVIPLAGLLLCNE